MVELREKKQHGSAKNHRKLNQTQVSYEIHLILTDFVSFENEKSVQRQEPMKILGPYSIRKGQFSRRTVRKRESARAFTSYAAKICAFYLIFFL